LGLALDGFFGQWVVGVVTSPWGVGLDLRGNGDHGATYICGGLAGLGGVFLACVFVAWVGHLLYILSPLKIARWRC
jgi:hypothetical protein